MVEKTLFWSQIFEIKILMDLDSMRSPEFENHIDCIWSMCLYVCMPVISINLKEIAVGTSNLVFYICIIYRCY